MGSLMMHPWGVGASKRLGLRRSLRQTSEGLEELGAEVRQELRRLAKV